MTFIEFTDDDMLRDKVVEPAWYTLLIQGFRTWTPTKDGMSNNCHYDCVIEKNADNGDTQFAGVPITLQFNDKPTAKGFIKGFFLGLGVDLKARTRYEFEGAIGKHIEAYITNETYNGRISSKADHKYRPARS